VEITKMCDFAVSSFFKLLLTIRRPADKTTENTQSYSLTFIETNPVTFCCCFSEIIRSCQIIRSWRC